MPGYRQAAGTQCREGTVIPMSSVGTSTRSGRLAVVTAQGELDIVTVPALRQELQAAVDSDAATIVVDCAAVTFADSSALSMLIATHKKLQPQGRRMIVANVRGPVMTVLRMSGAHRLLEVAEPGAFPISPSGA